ncbi:hypothetical protein CEUSTIGMA_g5670.t1 [Chlamydomonas eustigma]|uniref:Uncharacterized protein n=1 Tax=Chlamydomonas eustigma TaxID=1157962 RepID=A0A250X586_9CHLO|nr:hypothetical protein CEUSTIGMA_g5670.t1 [Chlamydomonas eustigma]|eukprot:GAX78228.1 hypothetical protein CEUSTIGMA_g5670.t1 [Chlamydomonas eustigma]
MLSTSNTSLPAVLSSTTQFGCPAVEDLSTSSPWFVALSALWRSILTDVANNPALGGPSNAEFLAYDVPSLEYIALSSQVQPTGSFNPYNGEATMTISLQPEANYPTRAARSYSKSVSGVPQYFSVTWTVLCNGNSASCSSNSSRCNLVIDCSVPIFPLLSHSESPCRSSSTVLLPNYLLLWLALYPLLETSVRGAKDYHHHSLEHVPSQHDVDCYHNTAHQCF